jgi:hypothetical protein
MALAMVPCMSCIAANSRNPLPHGPDRAQRAADVVSVAVKKDEIFALDLEAARDNFYPWAAAPQQHAMDLLRRGIHDLHHFKLLLLSLAVAPALSEIK